jgi:hypothetical protein
MIVVWGGCFRVGVHRRLVLRSSRHQFLSFLFFLFSPSQFFFLLLLFFYSALDISIDRLQEFGKVFVTVRLGIVPSQYERVAKPGITMCNIAIYSDKEKQVEVHVIKLII